MLNRVAVVEDEDTVMNLYHVRHAQPKANGNDSSLSHEDLQQSAKLGMQFVQVNPLRDRLAIIVSTLYRAHRTAGAIALKLDFETKGFDGLHLALSLKLVGHVLPSKAVQGV